MCSDMYSKTLSILPTDNRKLQMKENTRIETTGEYALSTQLKQKTRVEFLSSFFSSEEKTNIPLQIQTEIYSLAQKKQALSGHTCLSRDQPRLFYLYLKAFECMLPAVL